MKRWLVTLAPNGKSAYLIKDYEIRIANGMWWAGILSYNVIDPDGMRKAPK